MVECFILEQNLLFRSSIEFMLYFSLRLWTCNISKCRLAQLHLEFWVLLRLNWSRFWLHFQGSIARKWVLNLILHFYAHQYANFKSEDTNIVNISNELDSTLAFSIQFETKFKINNLTVYISSTTKQLYRAYGYGHIHYADIS